jgi:predicted CXXCH cytochrome family protein
MPNKFIVVVLSLLLGLTGLFGTAGATDPPHNGAENIFCSSCHIPHPVVPTSYFGSLTRDSNANLCLSCHFLGGVALNWPFASSDQAEPGTSGTSHRWDRDMTPGAAPLYLAAATPNNAYGLRTPSELATPALRTILTKYSNSVVCSTCHQQHSQANTPYDPYSYNASAGDGGGTATGGSLNTLTDTTKTGWTGSEWVGYTLVITGGTAANINQARTISGSTGSPDCTLTVSSNFPAAVQAGDTYYITNNATPSFNSGTATAGDSSDVVDGTKSWTTNYWAGYYVKMTGGANSGDRRRIQGNTANTLTLADAFTYPVAANDTYYITSARHFMRINSVTADMCNDCHYYRSFASMNGGIHQTDVHTWDGNEKSHPVGKGLSDVSDPSQFNAAFLEGYCSGPDPCSTLTMTGCSAGSGCTWNWAAEGGARGELNGGADTNLTNNITVGNDGKVNCLSCHNVHFADSDSATVDTPSGYAP